jgi:two-component system, LuxR family, response regulator FixJ
VKGRRHVVGVVDDDASVRGALLRLFRMLGLEVSLFATAEEYLAHPDQAEIDCLVIDVRLPGMGGLELLEKVQAESPRPALVITAHEDEQARAQTQAAGAVGFLLKPFDNCDVKAGVLQALGLPSRDRA